MVYCQYKKPTVSLKEYFQLVGSVFNILMLLTCQITFPKGIRTQWNKIFIHLQHFDQIEQNDVEFSLIIDLNCQLSITSITSTFVLSQFNISLELSYSIKHQFSIMSTGRNVFSSLFNVAINPSQDFGNTHMKSCS